MTTTNYSADSIIIMQEKAAKLRAQAAEYITADKLMLQADLLDKGGKGEFTGLYQGNRRVKARVIETKFGLCWLVHESESDIIAARGKPFLPCGKKSRVLKSLGLEERVELDFAEAKTCGGSGTGLGGCAGVYVGVVRDWDKCDKWGGTAELIESEGDYLRAYK